LRGVRPAPPSARMATDASTSAQPDSICGTMIGPWDLERLEQ
jgi:hypothetical protein